MSTPFSSMTKLTSEHEELVEEALSEIFESFERGDRSESGVRELLNARVQEGILEELIRGRLVEITGGNVATTPAGESIAKSVIRRKRLAERLLKDVLNVKDEYIDPAACQWEHILSRQVTDSICTLLGHPTQSPRDLPIPEGDCCRSEKMAVAPFISSLENLPRGKKGRIAYLLLKQNPELQRLLAHGLIPGTEIEVLQRFPTFVVQVNESQLAFDEHIAQAVFVHPL